VASAGRAARGQGAERGTDRARSARRAAPASDARPEVRDAREARARAGRGTRETRETREPRSAREPQETREKREKREARAAREPSESREAPETRKTRETRETRDAREKREKREKRDKREKRESRETREARDLREPRDARDGREATDGYEPEARIRAHAETARLPRTKLRSTVPRRAPLVTEVDPSVPIEKGTRVRVLDGPFVGKIGVVQDLDGKGGARVMLGLLATRLDVKDLIAAAEGRERPALASSHRRPMPVRN
jgi:transcription antitermination factor NusG